MVSLTEQHAAILSAQNDPELSGYLDFLNGKHSIQWSNTIPHVGLISAACDSNEKAFRRELLQLESRQISSNSEWIHNNTLIFFLLLGCNKWKIETILFDRIWDLDPGGNRYETEMRFALRSIHRKQRSYDGEYGFVKLGHDLLLDSNIVLEDDLTTVFQNLYSKEVYELEEGFFALLANWVFRAIVTRVKPAKEMSIERAVSCLANHQSKISLSLAWQLVRSLSISVIISILGLLSSIFLAGYAAHGLINVFFAPTGAAQSSSKASQTPLKSPSSDAPVVSPDDSPPR